MKTNELQYKAWESQVKSNKRILGDPSDFNSLIFEISADDYFQIGYNSESNSFVFLTFIDGCTTYTESENSTILTTWLKVVNEFPIN